MTQAWLLAALALLMWPGGGALPGRTAISRRTLQLVAAVATGSAAVAVVGGVPGLAVAVLAAPLAALAIGRLDATPRRGVPDPRLGLALDLVAAALRSGRPVPSALDLAAAAADDVTAVGLRQVAGLLRLGADARAAWHSLADHPVLAPVAHAAARSADSGVRLARGLEQVAAGLRDELRAAAEARAHRAGVLAMLPLGLCFLPAFVCLGVVPVVVGVAQGAFSAVP